MVLLGITGPIGHGKTTIAGFMAQQELTSQQIESSEIIAEVADRLNKYFVWDSPSELNLASVNNWLAHLPQILLSVAKSKVDASILHLAEQELTKHPEEYRKLLEYIHTARNKPVITQQHITAKNKGVYRPLLQWLGGYLVEHADKGIWYNEIIRRARLASKQGCKLYVVGGVRFPSDADIIRSAGGYIIQIQRPNRVEGDSTDPTERERSKIRPDAAVVNNGSLDELLVVSTQVYADFFGDRLKTQYVARARNDA